MEWSRLEEMGIKLDNDVLTKDENEEFKDLLIDNKDLFATDISRMLIVASIWNAYEGWKTD